MLFRSFFLEYCIEIKNLNLKVSWKEQPFYRKLILVLIFIKQCKNTRDFSREMNCTKILVSIQGNLYVDTEQNRATKKLNCWELLKLV